MSKSKGKKGRGSEKGKGQRKRRGTDRHGEEHLEMGIEGSRSRDRQVAT